VSADVGSGGPAAPRSAAGRGALGALAGLAPPVLFGVLFLTAWELFVRLRDIKPFLLPRPSAIWGELHGNAALIFRAVRASGTNALVGLVLGAALGIAVAFAASRFRVLGKLVTPMAVAVSAMPIIVVASVLYNMISNTSQVPRRFMAAIVVFFVVFVNVAKGLTEVTATQTELMRSYAASDTDVLRKVRIPNALSHLFIALKVAAPLAVVTAFVSEYFGGLQNGLGYFITSNISNSKDAVAWAYVVGAIVLGLVFYGTAVALERVAMPWQARRDRT
jgi:NitT/TauT family transport system permease protein